MKNKVLVIFLVLVMAVSNIFAVSNTDIIDVRLDEGNYTASQASKISLPFIRITEKNLVMDIDTKKSGLVISGERLEVDKKLEGVYILSAGEEVVIKGEVENALVFSPKVRIEGKVNGILVNFSEDLDISEKANINEIVTVSAKAKVLGKINENLIGAIGNLELKGEVEKDLRAAVEDLTIDANKVKGNIYLKTHNENLNVKYVYPNAKVDVIKVEDKKKAETMLKINDLLVAVLTCTIIYYLVEEVGKKKKITKASEKVTRKINMTLLFSAVSIACIFPVIFLSILLIGIGFSNIGIALMALFIGIFVAVTSMSMFITGAYISKCIVKAISKKTKVYEYLVVALVYASLYGLITIVAPLQIVNSMFALGIVATLLFVKEEKIEIVKKDKKEIKE